eukprot:COSAG04_NODE_5164_length_1717_cov_1.062423_1_plen_342_part_01
MAAAAGACDDVFYVERIEGSRKRGTELLIKWHGYSEEHNSWEPRENLGDDGAALVEAFEAACAATKKNPARRATPSGCHAAGAAVEARWPPSADGFDANWPMAGADKAWYAAKVEAVSIHPLRYTLAYADGGRAAGIGSDHVRAPAADAGAAAAALKTGSGAAAATGSPSSGSPAAAEQNSPPEEDDEDEESTKSEYELARERTIARNMEMLRALGLMETKEEIRKANTKAKRPSTPRTKHEGPVRKSARKPGASSASEATAEAEEGEDDWRPVHIRRSFFRNDGRDYGADASVSEWSAKMPTVTDGQGNELRRRLSCHVCTQCVASWGGAFSVPLGCSTCP